MKKLISVILSMAMVLCMTVTGFAEEKTYSITINNPAEGHTYEAYQIFAGDLSEKGVLSNITWGTGISAAGQTALGDAEKKAQTLTDEASAKAFAKEVAPYLATVAGSDSTVENGKYVISGLKPGYYLVKDQNTSLAGDHDAYTSYILKVLGDKELSPKSSIPTSQKKVKDTNDTTGVTTDWQDSADYDIGDKVPFQLKGTVANDYNEYKVYKYTFHDKMSAGLTFDSDSVKVYVDGNLIESGYEVVTSGIGDGCTFEVRFADLKQIPSVKAGSTITVEYEATLNENAVLGSEGNPNTSYLEYSNNPNDEQGGETGKTPEDKVIVFTYKTVINKVDGEGKPLAGAEFTLEKKMKDGTWKSIAVYEVKDNTTFTFKGLDDGEYRLTESKTPEGYNTIDPIYFKITATHDVEKANPELTGLTGIVVDKETGADITTGNVITFTADTTAGSLTTNVVNKSGATLPETGGIGTKIFYVVGAALVIGAGVLLITRKRMSTR